MSTHITIALFLLAASGQSTAEAPSGEVTHYPKLIHADLSTLPTAARSKSRSPWKKALWSMPMSNRAAARYSRIRRWQASKRGSFNPRRARDAMDFRGCSNGRDNKAREDHQSGPG